MVKRAVPRLGTSYFTFAITDYEWGSIFWFAVTVGPLLRKELCLKQGHQVRKSLTNIIAMSARAAVCL